MSARTKIVNFYMDDSGTKHPDRKPGRRPGHKHDWFALGGVLVHQEEEERARSLYHDFRTKWNVTASLHSSEIRSKSENFAWIGKLTKKDHDDFYEELYQLMRQIPCLGLACVIDRPGYNARYTETYRQDKWNLCKTAFAIAVERAAKYAQRHGAKLRVLPEKSNRTDDRLLSQYYEELRRSGSPFDIERQKGYMPLCADDYRKILREIKFKFKRSPLVQIADLYLWPMAIGGYHTANRPFSRLVADKKFVDQHCTDISLEGIKYSCFELEGKKL